MTRRSFFGGLLAACVLGPKALYGVWNRRLSKVAKPKPSKTVVTWVRSIHQGRQRECEVQRADACEEMLWGPG